MQRVIHLIEELRAVGIAVQPYPLADLPSDRAGAPANAAQDQADALEARVEAWRKAVIALHKSQFPTRAPMVRAQLEDSNVLIVDPDAILSMLLQELVSFQGHFAVVAPTAQAALDALAQKHFKAVLIDVDMRDGLGVAVARSIRLMYPSGTLLVALSAVHVQESVFDRCLTKPLNFESLWQILAA